MTSGIVISDLHWFAQRSRAPRLMQRIHAAATRAQVLVLNGDTFDFNWTACPSLESSVDEAERWIIDLCQRHPHCQVHFVIGNHDYFEPFLARLPGLEQRLPNFKWYMHCVRLGQCLFLHGDCATTPSTVADVMPYRRTWFKGVQRSSFASRVYTALVLAKLIHLTHLVAFPRPVVVRRLEKWIKLHHPEWDDCVKDVYFGHTHLPFTNHLFNGRCYHNTGSAIRTMPFQILTFEYEDNGDEDRQVESKGDRAAWESRLPTR